MHAQRLGVDIPIDAEDEELIFQSARIFRIENLEPLKKLRVRCTRKRLRTSGGAGYCRGFVRRLLPCAWCVQKFALIANEVTEIEGLEAQGPTLEQLELYQNHIGRIDQIQHLTNLRSQFLLPLIRAVKVLLLLLRQQLLRAVVYVVHAVI